jgi:uncharacterized Zn finger protein (UPF0148 family)
MSIQNLYYCPHCGSSYILISKYNIYCPICGLSYSKKQIENIIRENLLANEELEGIMHIFKTFSKYNLDALKKMKQ